MQIDDYQQHDRQDVVWLFERFQDFLVDVDPLGRLQRPPGYGDAALQRTLKQVAEYNGVFYVAHDQGSVIGFIVAIVLPPIEVDDVGVIPARRGRITELYVDTPYRRQGVGRLLMERAEASLKERGCRYIRLEVFAPNTNAHDFYKRLGYQNYDIDMMKRTD